MATMMSPTGHGGHGEKAICALVKPDAQRLALSESKLGAYQDEKLEIYHSQMKDMHEVFEKGRNLRGGLKQVYELWNKEILDRIAEIRAITEGHSNAHFGRLKDFGSEFDSNLSTRKKAWRRQFAADFEGLHKHSDAIEEATSGLSADIDKEREESLAQTEAETGPILEKLQEHRDNLAQQVQERDEQEAAFRKELATSFLQLRERIKAEKVVRTEQCVKDRADLEQRFKELNARFTEVHESLKKGREEIREAIEHERKENAGAQEHIVQNTMSFIQQFEAATRASTERQEAARKVIENIRESTRQA